ncbi:MAG TPA: glycyl-radical enzyme activating protein [Bacteroidales bacterium]|nr:MAG: 4-hydroxyphenylacetate decarboxylase activating enzyme [Bacteroidetes bacterium ADurb.Bin139]HOG24665.1 glycyl-radical enzyme activating protein [Bacteroidales bacterium]HOZ18855.1 glycyl-radical enzyme activating protein [Bacteroidales bacterium]HPB77570.1 glycyl-radical enzyme activating protein [Bacteroidales bacterium]HPK39786.1 glycyl-radical enzyme activating protein [Bacteroidales bacterium]
MRSSESMTPKGCIFDIRRYAIHDGPGIRLNVFFKGCPLRCQWCHNPEGQEPLPGLIFNQARCLDCGACKDYTLPHACPSGALETCGTWLDAEQVLHTALREKIFFDRSGGGITCTGGEPLMQSEFLVSLLAACREKGIHTAVDTCLYAPEIVLLQVIPHTSLFLADLKVMDPALHKQYTGADNTVIHSNLRVVARSGVPFALRIPLIPGVNDTRAELEAMTALALELQRTGNLTAIHLLPYHDYGKEKRYRILGGRTPFQGNFSSPPEKQVRAILGDFHRQGLPALRGG